MKKYYETKSRKKGAVRVCTTPGCGTQLSRYNPEKICGKCQAEEKEAERRRMKKMLEDLGI
jgi:hypothetical protein